MKKIVIEDDVFDICKRIKQIDSNYILVFNMALKRYELYYGENGFNEAAVLELTFSCKNLDARVITKILQTKRENMQKILAQIERQNKKIEEENKRKIEDEKNYKLTEMIKYSQNKFNKNLDFSDSYKQKWI